MKFQLEFEGEWKDTRAEVVAGEFWNEQPDDTLRKFMDDWELDAHTAALYLMLGGEEVSSRRGGRFRLSTE